VVVVGWGGGFSGRRTASTKLWFIRRKRGLIIANGGGNLCATADEDILTMTAGRIQ